MKLTTGILAMGLMLGIAWAQNPDVIENTRNTLQNVQQKQTNDQNAALTAAGQKPAPGKPATGNPAPPSKPAVQAAAPEASPKAAASEKKSAAPAAKSAVTKPADAAKAAVSEKKPVAATVKPVVTKPAGTPKAAAKKAAPKKQPTTVVKVDSPAKKPVAVEDKKVPEESKKKEPKEYSAAGRRDPFISPVVSHTASGSGCNSGKRCLAVDQIILTGIVKSEAGMIAVVVNSMNKAYFLRENDPVFNGYVVKITGDSVIFNQTIQDKLGKPFTREVTKRILTPAV